MIKQKTKSEEKIGRTFPDLINEHKRKLVIAFIILTILIVIIIIFAISRNNTVNFLGFELNPKEDINLKENKLNQIEAQPLSTVNTDSISLIAIEKNEYDPKSSHNSNIGKVKNTLTSDNLNNKVKLNEDKEPNNVFNNYGGKQLNVQENNGIILGDNNTINVNTIQRTLTSQMKKELPRLIDSILNANNRDKKCRIQILDAANTPESDKFAWENVNFLNSLGYVTWNAVDHEFGLMYSGERPRGQFVFFENDKVVIKIFDAPY